MDRRARKAAASAYKERGAPQGVYAVICLATGEAWVGRSRNLDGQRNGLWFALRRGSSPQASLQAAWRLHGEAAFRFEELDRLADGLSALAAARELEKREPLWRARLRASRLL